MALLMAYYNFVRPHSALRFGKTMRTSCHAGRPGQKQALIPRGLHKSGGIPFVCFDSDPILRHRGLPSELNNSCLKKRRKSKLDGKEEDSRMLLGKEVSKASIAKILDVSRSALYHFIETRKIVPD